MEKFECPEYLEITQQHVVLTYDGKKHTIKKPSALKLIALNKDIQTRDKEDIEGIFQHKIDTLINLGLEKPIAEALDLMTLTNTYIALSQDVTKKK